MNSRRKVQIWCDEETKNDLHRIKGDMPDKSLQQIINEAVSDYKKKRGIKTDGKFWPRL